MAHEWEEHRTDEYICTEDGKIALTVFKVGKYWRIVPIAFPRQGYLTAPEAIRAAEDILRKSY